MTEDTDKLVRGSIRVYKARIFYKGKDIQHINISYDHMKAILHVVTIPNDLKAIFEEVGIKWLPGTSPGLRVRKKIKGLNFDDIETADDGYLRIRFSGLTESDLKIKLKDAIKFFEAHNIEHGEKDGKAVCIFKCLTSKQLELGEF